MSAIIILTVQTADLRQVQVPTNNDAKQRHEDTDTRSSPRCLTDWPVGPVSQKRRRRFKTQDKNGPCVRLSSFSLTCCILLASFLAPILQEIFLGCTALCLSSDPQQPSISIKKKKIPPTLLQSLFWLRVWDPLNFSMVLINT